jgi:hypothetical protein
MAVLFVYHTYNKYLYLQYLKIQVFKIIKKLLVTIKQDSVQIIHVVLIILILYL